MKSKHTHAAGSSEAARLTLLCTLWMRCKCAAHLATTGSCCDQSIFRDMTALVHWGNLLRRISLHVETGAFKITQLVSLHASTRRHVHTYNVSVFVFYRQVFIHCFVCLCCGTCVSAPCMWARFSVSACWCAYASRLKCISRLPVVSQRGRWNS